jgi:hypothetical protein
VQSQKKKKNTREKARTVPGANFFKDWPMSLHKIMRLKFGGMIEVIKRERAFICSCDPHGNENLYVGQSILHSFLGSNAKKKLILNKT